MRSGELRELQAPLKERYRGEPETALVTLRAHGRLGDPGLTCKVETGPALVEAGLHPATGGDGLSACSGDMLLEALVACAGVTLRAVATALEIELHGGTLSAEGDLDFSRHAWRQPRGAGRLSRHSLALRSQDRRAGRQARKPDQTYRALLRRLSDLADAGQTRPIAPVDNIS